MNKGRTDKIVSGFFMYKFSFSELITLRLPAIAIILLITGFLGTGWYYSQREEQNESGSPEVTDISYSEFGILERRSGMIREDHNSSNFNTYSEQYHHDRFKVIEEDSEYISVKDDTGRMYVMYATGALLAVCIIIIVTFWLSIIWALRPNKKEGKKYFVKVPVILGWISFGMLTLTLLGSYLAFYILAQHHYELDYDHIIPSHSWFISLGADILVIVSLISFLKLKKREYLKGEGTGKIQGFLDQRRNSIPEMMKNSLPLYVILILILSLVVDSWFISENDTTWKFGSREYSVESEFDSILFEDHGMKVGQIYLYGNDHDNSNGEFEEDHQFRWYSMSISRVILMLLVFLSLFYFVFYISALMSRDRLRSKRWGRTAMFLGSGILLVLTSTVIFSIIAFIYTTNRIEPDVNIYPSYSWVLSGITCVILLVSLTILHRNRRNVEM